MPKGAPLPPSSTRDGNLRAYRQPDTVDLIRQRSGWIDVAERTMVNRVADEVRSRPILDIGVGGGRTSWMLRLLSDAYVAVDYSPEMVEACRLQCPGIDVRQCDARDLSAFEDGRFALVMFSFNGIDVLDHKGRLAALAEMHRVLEPGGVLLYSTGNRNGSLYARRPWSLRRARATRLVPTLVRLPMSLPRYWRTYRNWWQRRRFAEDHGSWAVCTSRAYEFRIVAHWTLPSTELHVLDSVGFTVGEMLGYEGAQVEDDSAITPYFYVLARKRES